MRRFAPALLRGFSPKNAPLAGAAALATLPLLGGCSDGAPIQSALHPAGAGSEEIAWLWWLFLGVCTAVYILVLGLLFWAVARRRREGGQPEQVSERMWLGLGGFALPIAVIGLFLFATLGVLASQSAMLAATGNPTIKVIGHRWWWEVRYVPPEPHRQLTTANEIYIPVNKTVRIELESRDIIHSFWVPALQGKTDMIPGRTNVQTIRATRAGEYRGQCAEFCGLQHANMALMVIAVPEDEFQAWYDGQLRSAAPPATPAAERGQRVFSERSCAQCHAIRGTSALARSGPDLTHLATRQTLAAGALPNTRGHLGGWLSNPQSLKPGSLMPNTDLNSEELLALIAYLEGLK
jgi:cytochrome c oxidase subunit II